MKRVRFFKYSATVVLLIATLKGLAQEIDVNLSWELHPKFVIPDTRYTNQIVVLGYNRQSGKYLPSYLNPDGYSATIRIEVEQQGMVNRGNLFFDVSIEGLQNHNGESINFQFNVETQKRVLYSGSSTVVDLDTSVETMPKFPFQGTYRAKLSAYQKLKNGNRIQLAKHEEIINVKDYLIVAMGDSFASGEGNPDFGNVEIITDPNTGEQSFVLSNPEWLEPRGNRSFKSSFSLIAKKLEDSDTKSIVTFIHIPSSGAKISDGLIFPQNPSWQDEGQIYELVKYIGNRPIDGLLLSIGLNDLGECSGISDIIIEAANPLPPEFKESGSLQYARQILPTISQSYDVLAQLFEKNLKVRNVFLFEPPVQFMRDEYNNLSDGCGLLTTMENEDIVILETIGLQLLQIQKDACTRNGWQYITGINDLFKNHGYCAGDQSWFISIMESKNSQGNLNGAVHPNSTGHQKIMEHAYPTIKTALENQTINVQAPVNKN